MRLRTGNHRRRRAFWRGKGKVWLRATARGVWLRMPPEWAEIGAQCLANGDEQPRFYRWYP